MGRAATSYFQNIFSSDHNLDASPIIDLIEPVISDDSNASLCAEFSDKEISGTIFQIGPSKAPGPYGFPAHFFQHNWGTLKENIISAVNAFFRTCIIPHEVNDMVIVMIPKIPNPLKIHEVQAD